SGGNQSGGGVAGPKAWVGLSVPEPLSAGVPGSLDDGSLGSGSPGSLGRGDFDGSVLADVVGSDDGGSLGVSLAVSDGLCVGLCVLVGEEPPEAVLDGDVS